VTKGRDGEQSLSVRGEGQKCRGGRNDPEERAETRLVNRRQDLTGQRPFSMKVRLSVIPEANRQLNKPRRKAAVSVPDETFRVE